MFLLDDVHSILERWRSRLTGIGLPSVHDLKEFIETPLQEDEKIPITFKRMLELVCGTCEAEDAGLLFRANDASTPLDRIFFTVLDDPPEDGNEASLHSFWDDNIRKVLHVLIPNGRSMRNCINDATVRDLRPDYAFLVGTLCIFRGEEAGVGSHIDTKAILARRVEWTYDPAPYVFGMTSQNSATVTLIELR